MLVDDRSFSDPSFPRRSESIESVGNRRRWIIVVIVALIIVIMVGIGVGIGVGKFMHGK